MAIARKPVRNHNAATSPDDADRAAEAFIAAAVPVTTKGKAGTAEVVYPQPCA
jgi:hypothetical protein